MVVLFLIFGGASISFSVASAPFPIPMMHEGPLSSTSSPTLICCPPGDSCPNRYEVPSHWFWFAFLCFFFFLLLFFVLPRFPWRLARTHGFRYFLPQKCPHPPTRDFQRWPWPASIPVTISTCNCFNWFSEYFWTICKGLHQLWRKKKQIPNTYIDRLQLKSVSVWEWNLLIHSKFSFAKKRLFALF